MTEFTHPGHKKKTFLTVPVLQNAVKTFQTALNFLNTRFGYIVKNRLIVFINQNNDLSLFRQSINQIAKTQSGRTACHLNIMFFGYSLYFCHKIIGEFFQSI